MADLFEKSVKNAEPVQEMMESNMLMIRHLDVQCKLKENDVKQKLTTLINSWKKLSKEQQRRDYEAARSCLAKAKELSERKVELASQTYECVDEFIQKLDHDTAEFNNYVYQKQLNKTSENKTDVTLTDKKTNYETQLKDKRCRQVPFSSTSSTAKKNIRRRKRTGDDVTVDDQKNFEQTIATEVEPTTHADMPVDPNEPRYCICNQVSFGHMVCCDNKNCPLEWFHFFCVGLTSSPKGKWYCPQCEDKDGKKQQRQKIARKGKDH